MHRITSILRFPTGHPTPPYASIEFSNDSGTGKEVESFIRAVRQYAFERDKSNDDAWIARFASTCLLGTALRWYETLPSAIQDSWKLLRQALLDRYPARQEEKAVDFTIPTPAAAAAPTQPLAVNINRSLPGQCESAPTPYSGDHPASPSQLTFHNVQLLESESLHLSPPLPFKKGRQEPIQARGQPTPPAFENLRRQLNNESESTPNQLTERNIARLHLQTGRYEEIPFEDEVPRQIIKVPPISREGRPSRCQIGRIKAIVSGNTLEEPFVSSELNGGCFAVCASSFSEALEVQFFPATGQMHALNTDAYLSHLGVTWSSQVPDPSPGSSDGAQLTVFGYDNAGEQLFTDSSWAGPTWGVIWESNKAGELTAYVQENEDEPRTRVIFAVNLKESLRIYATYNYDAFVAGKEDDYKPVRFVFVEST